MIHDFPHGPAPGTDQRRFLFLQGPHGPFFGQLGRMLRAAGARTWRVGFNRGDAVFWPDRASYIPYRAAPALWPETCAALLAEHAITDLVLYGDTRPIHAEAIACARARGLRVHVFEEGYLRPFWITYERGGANGHSRLMETSVPEMAAALATRDQEHREAPAHWGDMRQHIFYGAVYHGCVMALNHGYRQFRPHRALTVGQEFKLYLRRLLLMPFTALERRWATRRILRGCFPFHLVLLQLAHDASFKNHSPFKDMDSFLRLVIEGFASGAPAHHHLVLKAHPLEDGRVPLRRIIRQLARAHGVQARVHYVRGGKLAGLLNAARTAITVNSTAAQQALWRGLPLKTYGAAVYAKPEFVSDQPLPVFFVAPTPPDTTAYRAFRSYLLETSQLPGGFYSARGRRQVLRRVVDRMLSDLDPYEALTQGTPAAPAPLRLVT